MFLDRAEIEVVGGRGGNGCVSFRREKYAPFGGPNGGDGGKGGDVILVVDERRTTLQDFRYHRVFKGERGEHGEGSQRTGRSGEDVLVPVPAGTLVYDAATEELLEDLTRSDQRLFVARGGRGGRGNEHFKTSTNRAPRKFEEGGVGEERRLRLELKLIADVGLVGFPNAGKSTLLSSISDARPKIADYPFTTLTPNLGVVRLTGFRDLVVADIPGILEGAHQGKGLGLEFLRHIERTRALLFLVDATSEHPAADFATLREELRLYSEELLRRPHLLVLTKADLFEDPKIPNELLDRRDVRLISAVSGAGIPLLLEEAYSLTREAAPAEETSRDE